MTRHITIFVFVSTGFALQAQLKAVKSYPIAVNYEKTLHLVFPTPVKYFSSVSDFVIVDNPDNAKNIIRLKANEGSFSKKTTVSVATADGEFYTFDAVYSENITKTNVIVNKNGSFTNVKPEIIYVNNSAQTHLILPGKIEYFDFGNPRTVTCDVAENTDNILRITSNRDKFSDITNLSFVTSDGKFHTFDLAFSENPPAYVYQIGEGREQKAMISGEVRPEDREDDINKIKRTGRRVFNIGLVSDRIKISLFNIFANSSTKLFLQIEIKNNSNINYDIDFIKFYIEDKKKSKKTVSQQIDVEPAYNDGMVGTVNGKSSAVIIFSFEKFTISNKQSFNIQVNEKNGGRNFILSIDDKTLSDVTAL